MFADYWDIQHSLLQHRYLNVESLILDKLSIRCSSKYNFNLYNVNYMFHKISYSINLLSAYDFISRHAIAVMQLPVCLITCYS